MSALQVIVVTPEKTTLDQSCEFVALPMFDGEAGVMAGHAPLIGRLKPGEIRVRADGKASHYYVDGGFVQIDNNVVSVLTGRSIPVNEIDLAAAKQSLDAAMALEAGNEALAEIKDKALAQARAQINLAQK